MNDDYAGPQGSADVTRIAGGIRATACGVWACIPHLVRRFALHGKRGMGAHRWGAGCGFVLAMVLWQGVGWCGTPPVVRALGERADLRYCTGVEDLLPMPDGAVAVRMAGWGVGLLGSHDSPSDLLWERGDGLENAAWLLPGDDGELLVVASTKGDKGQFRVVSLNVETKRRRRLSPDLSFDRPTSVCWNGGTGWLCLREGEGIVEITEGKARLHGRKPLPHTARLSYRLLAPDAAHGGGLWAIPSGQHTLPVLRDRSRIIRIRDGERLEFAYPERVMHTPRLDENGSVEALTEAGIERLELQDGVLKLVLVAPAPLPILGVPQFLDRLPNGDWFALWYPKPKEKMPWVTLPGIKGLQRTTSRAAVYNGQDWRLLDLPAGVGRDLHRGHREARPSALLPDGTWVVAVAGGLLIRRPDGTWERRNEASGVPAFWFIRFCPDADGLLWMLTRWQGCVSLDLQGMGLPHKTWRPGWSSVALRKPLHALPSGSHVRVEWGNPPLIAWSGRLAQPPAPLPQDAFDLRDLDSLTHDTDGRTWLFGHGRTPAVAYWEQGKWRVFRGQQGKRLSVGATRLLVLESRQGRLPDYRIGDIWEPHWVQYQKAGDGSERILYIQGHSTSPWFFDGKSWHSPLYMIPYSLGRRQGYPFFWQRNLTIRTDKGCYYLPDADWSKMPTVWRPAAAEELSHEDRKRIAGLWRKLDLDVPYPYPEKRERLQEARAAPPLPVPSEQVRWQGWSHDRAWLGTADRLYWSAGDLWHSIPTAGTPLGCLASVAEVADGADGDIWFRISGIGYYGTCYARLQVAPLAVQILAEGHLGTVRTLSAVLFPAFQANQPEDSLRFRHRAPGGKWSPMRSTPSFQFMVEEKGTYHVQLEISVAESPVAPVVLDYTYDVAIGVDEWTRRFVRGLGSRHHAERVAAQKALVAIGPPALAAARSACRSLDPEVATRARRVVAEIELQQKTAVK